MSLIKYGRKWDRRTDPFVMELKCFDLELTPEQGGLGRFEHLKNAIDIRWNWPRRVAAQKQGKFYDPDKDDAFIWNEWTEMMMRAYCENREVIVAGPGASYKTGTLALYKLCSWLCSPHNTRIILTSTTGDGLRARIWKELIHFYRAVSEAGHLVQSRTMIQFRKGDDGAGIYGIAVESDGNIEKAINKIVGRHNTKMGVGVDEMPTVSGAIVEACVNLETGAERFEFAGIGNPDSHFDPHGRMAEPKDGWESITVDTQQWRTQRGGLCIHLDGRRSPRIGNDDKFPGLIRQQDLERTESQYGEDSPQMWKQRYGFWAPEGITKTVLSETMISQFRAKDKAVWVGGFTLAAGLDPSFEGRDRCVLKIVKFGEIDGGKHAIEFYKTHIIKLRTTDAKDLHYQIVKQVKEICEGEGVEPKLFGLDSTGEGGGLVSIFAREWSPEIKAIEFGGRASDKPISEVRPDAKEKVKLGYEEYLNRVTELWYGFRVLVRNGQIRGLDDDTAIEFCKRYYELRGNMLLVESKKLMKARTGKSPDLADGAVVAVAVVQENDRLLSGLPSSGKSSKEWSKIVKKHQSIFDEEESYMPEEALR